MSADGATDGFRRAVACPRSLIAYPMQAGPPSVPRSVKAPLAQITARGSLPLIGAIARWPMRVREVGALCQSGRAAVLRL